jgi:predicted Zn-dependent peptidase
MLEVRYPTISHRLANGLQVLASPDPNAPAVAVNLWYRVGSGDDPAGSSGFAHLFEHLMFAGSEHVANTEHLSQIEAIGGTANATTSFDRTNYFETVPVNGTELALWLEADRMASLAVTQENLDTQREVVKEEKRQRYDNVPYGDLLELVLALNFPPGHPYHVPTIGSEADLNAAQLSAVTAFHDRYYKPDQASLVVCGPLEAEQIFEWAEKYFGDIPSGNPIVNAPDVELPPHTGIPRQVVHRPAPAPILQLCWRSPAEGQEHELALSVGLSVLGSGQSSRLHLKLVRELEAADSVGAADFGLSRGTSLASISARPRPGHSLDELETLIDDEISRLIKDGPTEAELARVNANLEREWFQHLSTVDERADAINEFAVLLGDPEQVNTRLAKLHAVTADDVKTALELWLDPEFRAVLDYEPTTDTEGDNK